MNKINFVNYPDIKQYRNIVKEMGEGDDKMYDLIKDYYK